jgi:hypothetical protein
VPLAASPLRGCCPLPQAAPGCGAACLLANWPPQGRNQLCRSDKSNRYRFRKKLLSCGDSLTESNRRPSPYHLSTGRRCSHQRRRRPGRSAVGQLIWSSHAAPAARTPRCWRAPWPQSPPASGHAVQPPRGRGRNGRPPGRRAAGAGRGQGPAPARQGSRRRAAAGWLTSPPSARPASAARTASAGETSPAHNRTPPAPHPPARPAPAGHQTRPRHPARPAPGRPDLPMSGRAGPE